MDEQPSAATQTVGPGSELTLRSDRPTVGPGADRWSTGLAPGESLGRYVLVERIGFGGMGEVYRAFDPELGRLVAIKHVLGDQVDEADQRRLQQEAKAIAQLSHPNVVQVYDVGRDQATRRVFIAMEHVEGPTLRKWVADDHDVQTIIDCYVQAGRGLAAAHERGIVHRDFKPANVLVDPKGRAKVLDFGLAQPSAGHRVELSPAISPEMDSAGPSDPYELLRGITGAGGRLGTPAYMSPEQFAGLETDGRADQFSFAVALYEALHGELPFVGKTVEAYACSVLDGNAQPPPRRADIPRHVSLALERALDPDPDLRFPTMDALLAELTRRPGASRNRWLAGGAMALLAAGGVTWGSIQNRDGGGARIEACEQAFANVGAHFDRSSVERSLAAADRPFAADLASRAGTRLEASHTRWNELTKLECASPSRGELGEARRLCLSRHAARERRLLHALDDPNPADLDHVMSAIVGLETHLDSCEDPAQLEELAPAAALPDDRRDEILGALEAVELAALLGRYPQARERLTSLGEAQRSWPTALRYDWLVRAVDLELESGSTQAAATLVDDHIGSLLAAGLEPGRAREFDSMLGKLRAYQEDYEGSDRAYRRYHAACVDALGPGHRNTILAFAALGHAPDATGDYERAHEIYTQAYESAQAAGLAPVDRMTLRSHVALSAAHLGRLSEAQQAYEDVLEWNVAQNGANHPDTEMARFDVAYVLLRSGDGSGAATMFEDLLERMAADPNWSSPFDEISMLGNLGAAYLLADRPQAAETALRRALELADATVGEEANQQGMALRANLGGLLDRQGRHEDAVIVLAQAVAIVDASGTQAAHNGVMARNNLAVAQAKAGDTRGAHATVKAALRYALQSGSQELVALTRLREARVSVQVGDEDAARDALLALHDQPLDEETRARIDAEIVRLELESLVARPDSQPGWQPNEKGTP